jgi:putative ABC transport system permease protein
MALSKRKSIKPKRGFSVSAKLPGIIHQFFEGVMIALRAIRTNKLRAILTLIGIVIGVATVITVVSVINGMNNYVASKINTLGPSTFVVDRFGIITSDEDYFKAMRRKKLTLDDMNAIKRYCPLCEDIGANSGSNGKVKYGSQYLDDIYIMGVTPNVIDITDIDIATGRSFNESDDESHRAICIIGPDVADILFGGRDPLDKMIKIDDYYLRVVGIGTRRGSFLGQNQDLWVIIPLQTFGKYFGRRLDLSLNVKAVSVAAMEEAQDQARVILRNRRGDKYKDPDSFGMMTAASLMKLYNDFVSTAWVVLVGVASISLVVGGIVIMNIMLVSVTERTREIGIRKALGARRKDILWQFLVESVTLSILGGAIGVGLGSGLSLLVKAYSPLPAAIETWAVMAGLLIATSVGIFFGIFPAMRAARLDPVECLRYE